MTETTHPFQPKPYTTEINIMFDCFDYDLLAKVGRVNEKPVLNSWPYSAPFDVNGDY